MINYFNNLIFDIPVCWTMLDQEDVIEWISLETPYNLTSEDISLFGMDFYFPPNIS